MSLHLCMQMISNVLRIAHFHRCAFLIPLGAFHHFFCTMDEGVSFFLTGATTTPRGLGRAGEARTTAAAASTASTAARNASWSDPCQSCSTAWPAAAAVYASATSDDAAARSTTTREAAPTAAAAASWGSTTDGSRAAAGDAGPAPTDADAAANASAAAAATTIRAV